MQGDYGGKRLHLLTKFLKFYNIVLPKLYTTLAQRASTKAESCKQGKGNYKTIVETSIRKKNTVKSLSSNEFRRRKKKELRKRNAECSRSLRQSELAFLGPPSMTEPPPPSTLITDLALTYRPHFRHQVGTRSIRYKLY